ncbi:unnamed protein product, partial [Iphiclides podalirius]
MNLTRLRHRQASGLRVREIASTYIQHIVAMKRSTIFKILLLGAIVAAVNAQDDDDDGDIIPPEFGPRPGAAPPIEPGRVPETHPIPEEFPFPYDELPGWK